MQYKLTQTKRWGKKVMGKSGGDVTVVVVVRGMGESEGQQADERVGAGWRAELAWADDERKTGKRLPWIRNTREHS